MHFSGKALNRRRTSKFSNCLVKVVPRRHLDKAADLGVGFSPVADAFRVDGCIAPSHRFARPDEDLRLHAVAAALEMIQRIDDLQDYFRSEGWAEIRVGVGVNTGEMSVGNMGSEFRVAFTVMGDAVNLGSRIEGLTRRYGVPIIVTESTVTATPEYAYINLDLVRVKGKKQRVGIFCPIGLNTSLSDEQRSFIANHSQAMQDYQSHKFERAL